MTRGVSVTPATPIFRAIMMEIERRRVALGFPMAQFSEYAGLPERYYPKSLHADGKSGRQATWATLQVMIDALFPAGFDVEIRARPGAPMNYESLKAKLLQLRARTDPRTQRELMRQLGRKGGAASRGKPRRKLPKQQRREIARNAAKKRWETPRIVEITRPKSCPKHDAHAAS